MPRKHPNYQGGMWVGIAAIVLGLLLPIEGKGFIVLAGVLLTTHNGLMWFFQRRGN